MKRVQSPSSINTYFQCPRKYYFIYNLNIETKPSIHLIRGSIAHSALENFFTLDPKAVSELPKDFRHTFRIVMIELLKKYWNQSKNKLDALQLSNSELLDYYGETQEMLLNWAGQFSDRIEGAMGEGKSFVDSFRMLTPKTEIEYKDDGLMVRGFIDAIEHVDGKTRLMDYKTSKSSYMDDSYRTQLGIYALLYERKHGKRADTVGIYFLKDCEKTMTVSDEIITHAKFMIEQIHASTDGIDGIDDYPKKESALCNWGRGKCDFYEYCFLGKKIPEGKGERKSRR